jgi:predicted ATPase
LIEEIIIEHQIREAEYEKIVKEIVNGIYIYGRGLGDGKTG